MTFWVLNLAHAMKKKMNFAGKETIHFKFLESIVSKVKTLGHFSESFHVRFCAIDEKISTSVNSTNKPFSSTIKVRVNET